MAVIDQYRSLLTVLVVFELSPEQVDEQIATIKEFLLESVKQQPGFVSANLHISLDKTRIVNYAQWRTEQDYQNFLENEDVQAKASKILKIKPTTTLMKVALAT